MLKHKPLIVIGLFLTLFFVGAAALSWTCEGAETANGTGQHTSIIAYDGNLHIANYYISSGDLHFCSKPINNSQGWVCGAVETENGPGTYNYMLSYDSNLHIFHYESSNKDIRHCTRPTNNSQGWVCGAVDTNNDTGSYLSATVSDNNFHTAYYLTTTGDLRYCTRPTNNSQGWVCESPDITSITGRYTSIVVYDSNVHIAYYYASGQTPNFCTRPLNNSQGWVCGTVETGLSGGKYSKMLVHDSNFYIAHYNASADDPRLCTRPTDNSQGWVCEIVESTNLTGEYLSFIVSDSNFHISHYDTSNDDLRYCSRPIDNSQPWVCGPAETTGNVGQYTSIVASDGNLFISHYDADNYDLRVCTARNIYTSPDVNVIKIDSNLDSLGLPVFAFATDGNLTIDFNAMDPNSGDATALTVDINYSAANTDGSGTVIIDNLSLSAAVCDDANFEDVTTCSWDWDIENIDDTNYYVNILISDGVLTAFNASDNTMQTVNASAPDINIVTFDNYDQNAASPFFSDSKDGNVTIAFHVYDKNPGTELTVDINYSVAATQGTGTVIVNDLNLSTAICGSPNFASIVSCTWDWNTYGVTDGNYYILIEVNDSALTDFNASDTNIGTDNTPPTNLTISPGSQNTDYVATVSFSAIDAFVGLKNYWVSINGAAYVDNSSTTTFDVNCIISNITFALIATDWTDNNSAAETAIFNCFKDLRGTGVAYCGDGTCNGSETPATCANDCSAICGDGACTHTESIFSCPVDCYGCGDGTCSGLETFITCPTDCAKEEELPSVETVESPEPTEKEIKNLLEQAGLTQSATQIISNRKQIEVTRTVNIKENKTTATISVANKSNNKHRNVVILETIPKSIAESTALLKTEQPFTIIKDDPIIQFTIPELLPGQIAKIEYFVEKTVSNAVLSVWAEPIPISFEERSITATECIADTDCSDSNPCTKETCIMGTCFYAAKSDGTTCAPRKQCSEAKCVEIEGGIMGTQTEGTNLLLYATIAITVIVLIGAYYYMKE